MSYFSDSLLVSFKLKSKETFCTLSFCFGFLRHVVDEHFNFTEERTASILSSMFLQNSHRLSSTSQYRNIE
jgi:hypothetical protein